jgi:DNA-binding beta-propeller fold protein YncE
MNPPRCARRLIAVTAAATIILMAVMTAGCGSKGTTNSGGSSTATNPGSSAAPNTTATAATTGTPSPGQTSQSTTAAGSAVVLPFTGLDRPVGVAVDVNGGVYVTDSGNNRVVKLAPNSYTQSVPPFTGLNNPVGVSAQNYGDLYVTDANNNRMLWDKAPQSTPTPPWQSASSTEWVGPFTGLQSPQGALMYSGSYFVVDSGNNRVLTWRSGTNAPSVVPFTGLNNPDGVSVLNRGWLDVYVADAGNNRVVNVAAESNGPQQQAVLSFTGLNSPHGVAADQSVTGTVYVTDSGNNRVLKLKTDPNTKVATQSILPFAGLNNPRGIAQDTQGNLCGTVNFWEWRDASGPTPSADERPTVSRPRNPRPRRRRLRGSYPLLLGSVEPGSRHRRLSIPGRCSNRSQPICPRWCTRGNRSHRAVGPCSTTSVPDQAVWGRIERF